MVLWACEAPLKGCTWLDSERLENVRVGICCSLLNEVDWTRFGGCVVSCDFELV